MRRDWIFFLFVAAVVVGSAGVFLGVVSAAAHGSVFNVTDPANGIYRMHEPLLNGDRP